MSAKSDDCRRREEEEEEELNRFLLNITNFMSLIWQPAVIK